MKKIEKYTEAFNEVQYNKPTISVSVLVDHTNHIIGKLLTIIDATVSNEKQNKAMKDLVRATVWQTHGILENWAMVQTDAMGSTSPYSNFEPPINRI